MTTYISREETLKKIDELSDGETREILYKEIYAMLSLQDQVVELIEKKIESLQNSKIDNPVNALYCRGMIIIYQELLSEIKLLNN